MYKLLKRVFQAVSAAFSLKHRWLASYKALVSSLLSKSAPSDLFIFLFILSPQPIPKVDLKLMEFPFNNLTYRTKKSIASETNT